MSEPYTGGCACGAIRYEISTEPLFRTTASASTVNGRAAPDTDRT